MSGSDAIDEEECVLRMLDPEELRVESNDATNSNPNDPLSGPRPCPRCPDDDALAIFHHTLHANLHSKHHQLDMASTASSDGPPVVRDPRFKAGRTLIQSGRANEGAVEIFATLLEVSNLVLIVMSLSVPAREFSHLPWTGNLEQVWRNKCRSSYMLL